MRGFSPGSRAALIVAIILGAGMPASGQDETSLEKARLEFKLAQERIDKKLIADFETVLTRTGESGGKVERRLAVIDVVKKEKERFEKSGLIPWSAPMRSYSQSYLKSLETVQNRLAKAYGTEIDVQLRLKNDEKVKALRDDLDSVLNVRVLAQWRHQAGNGQPGVMKLFSNGRIDDPDAKATWTIDGRVLVLVRVNAKAPGGAWVDRCAVSDDGLTYSGFNQNRVSITGVYIQP